MEARMSRGRSGAVGVVVGALALLSVGCGSSGGSGGNADAGSKPPADAVHVVARDISFDAATYDATAGDVEIDYQNDGAIEHTLEIEGVDGFELKVAKHGDTDSGSVELQPGEYKIFCAIPGHRAAGMEATLKVS
jgi:plastocyanin